MDKVKKYQDFIKDEIEPKEKKKDQALTDDLTDIQKELDKVQKAKGSDEFEIVNILDITTVEPKIDEAIVINAELGNTTVKRGDDIYITAMLKKKGSYTAPDIMGVLKVRVVDIYNSLSVLNRINK